MVSRKKAVEIARDVIAQLKTNQIKPSPGTYFEAGLPVDIDRKSDLRDNIKGVPCHVCALGGLFVANVLRHDKFPVKDAIDSWDDTLSVSFRDISDNLSKIFTPKNLELIEAVFEGEFVVERFHSPGEVLEMNPMINKYRKKYERSGDRMRVIMLNIIRNNGKFVLPKRIS